MYRANLASGAIRIKELFQKKFQCFCMPFTQSKVLSLKTELILLTGVLRCAAIHLDHNGVLLAQGVVGHSRTPVWLVGCILGKVWSTPVYTSCFSTVFITNVFDSVQLLRSQSVG